MTPEVVGNCLGDGTTCAEGLETTLALTVSSCFGEDESGGSGGERAGGEDGACAAGGSEDASGSHTAGGVELRVSAGVTFEHGDW